MAEILGVGFTHYPPLMSGKPEAYAGILKGILRSPKVPEEMKDPKNWPAGMQDEWEHEVERAHAHQEQHRQAFLKVRKAIDAFKPDAVFMFGDDQYENFKETIIPPFNIFCAPEFPSHPFRAENNLWGVDPSETITYKGAPTLARDVANEFMERHFPVPYSYTPQTLHFEHGMTHAFINGLTYLDWDHDNPWTYPTVPISVNCYGKLVVSNRGGSANIQDMRSESEKDPLIDYPGPQGPSPKSCFALGEMLRQILEERDGRYAIIASSGWSHAFLTEKHNWLWPDRDFDRARFEELKSGEHSKWEHLTSAEIDDAGDQEFKNWICLAGAMQDRKAEIIEYLETWIFNSEKCFAVFHNGNGS